jgi:hypothetical protein
MPALEPIWKNWPIQDKTFPLLAVLMNGQE